jgi:hypothetical protein
VSVHTGIYESDQKVIQFTCASAQSSTGFTIGSASSSFREFCWECRQALSRGGVVSCCLDCFLKGDNLCLFAYSVPPWFYAARNIGMLVANTNRALLTCTVLGRANDLARNGNGFGTYDALVNNCFDFAFYCKTGCGLFSLERVATIMVAHQDDGPTCMIM